MHYSELLVIRVDVNSATIITLMYNISPKQNKFRSQMTRKRNRISKLQILPIRPVSYKHPNTNLCTYWMGNVVFALKTRNPPIATLCQHMLLCSKITVIFHIKWSILKLVQYTKPLGVLCGVCALLKINMGRVQDLFYTYDIVRT